MSYKAIRRLLISAIVVISGLFLSLVISREITPYLVNVKHKTITSEYIPDSHNNMEIAFFSDLELFYRKDLSFYEKALNKLNNQGADVVIFGGDMFNNLDHKMSKDEKNRIIKMLKDIDAPYGKFAVLGEKDYIDSKPNKDVLSILEAANFEVLTNDSSKIYLDSTSYIDLIGLDYYKEYKTLSQIEDNNFSIVVSHRPNVSDTLRESALDLQLSGHVRACQFKIPIVGPICSGDGISHIHYGYRNLNGYQVIDSGGLGEANTTVRVNAMPEFNIITLNKPMEENIPS